MMFVDDRWKGRAKQLVVGFLDNLLFLSGSSYVLTGRTPLGVRRILCTRTCTVSL